MQYTQHLTIKNDNIYSAQNITKKKDTLCTAKHLHTREVPTLALCDYIFDRFPLFYLTVRLHNIHRASSVTNSEIRQHFSTSL